MKFVCIVMLLIYQVVLCFHQHFLQEQGENTDWTSLLIGEITIAICIISALG